MSEEIKRDTLRLTPRQRAEAAALWVAGSVTLADLSAKYGKRQEAFSRLFKRMGIEKGSGIEETATTAAATAVAAAVEEATKNEVDEVLKRIRAVKERHYGMSQMLAQMAFQDIQRTRTSGGDVGDLRKTMAVYKMAADVLSITRKEAYDLLNVPKHEATEELDDLPDLTVRELTQEEVGQLRDAPQADDMGAGLGDELDDDGGLE